jgi:hypothetical protein
MYMLFYDNCQDTINTSIFSTKLHYVYFLQYRALLSSKNFEDTKVVIRRRYRKRTDNTMAKRNRPNKDKQRSTKHYIEIKRTSSINPIQSGRKIRCSGEVSSSCSSHDTHRVTIVTNLVISLL